MKKTSNQTARRPLTLDRQTIRQLSSAEMHLERAAGGLTGTACSEPCTLRCKPTLECL